jgi:ankyrin repeat protein
MLNPSIRRQMKQQCKHICIGSAVACHNEHPFSNTRADSLRLLRHLFTWEIDLNVVDHMRLTALHYAYLFKQEECTKFLIHSGVDQFILDGLGRSSSDLDSPFDVRLRSNMDIDSDNHTEGASCKGRHTGNLFLLHCVMSSSPCRLSTVSRMHRSFSLLP